MSSALQPPIGSYALIGDTRTAALCSTDGAIDWLCVPRFDSNPLFSRLIAGDEGGTFSIRVPGARPAERRYRERSAVLETTLRGERGEIVVTDGMVVDVEGALFPRLVLVRRLEASGAPVDAEVLFDPRLGLPPRRPARVERRNGVVLSSWGSLAVALRADADLEIQPGVTAAVTVDPSRPVTLVMSVALREPLILLDPETARAALESSDRSWRAWSDGISYDGPHAATVLRSLLTLRLLTYSPSGATVAAPTTSLPEVIGGERNWDYRFSWPRDSSIGIEAFLGVGRAQEARTYLHWLLHASRITRPRLQVVYTLDGKPGAGEQELGLPGYRGSRPVRVGNGATDQHQLDVYGWVLGAAAAMERSGERLDGETWRAMADLADFVARGWRRPDAGIWESRGRPRQYVHSKLMAWLALDRALRLTSSRRVRGARVRRWTAARDGIAALVRREGWNEERGTYADAFDGDGLDAALLVPLVEFEGASSSRASATVDAITHRLSAGGPLLYRYPQRTDGLEGSEGAFIACSFWLVEALVALRRVEEAAEIFGGMCERANDVGLFAEEMDPSTAEHLGNFPQALSHAALVRAALALDEATA